MTREEELKDSIIKRLDGIKQKYSSMSSKEDIQKLLLERRNEENLSKLEFFLKNESLVLSRISNKIDFNNISPILKLVETKEDTISWEYLRGLVSSAPHTGYVGRSMKFLMIESISNNICGIASIGSDLANIGARDKLIGWTHEDKFKKKKLGCGFNINVCICLQPYGTLLFGKLLAMMLCSNEIRELWKSKYKDPCCYVLTTSLYGKSSQYNRIDEYIKYIGDTKGFGSLHIDKGTYKLISEYLSLIGDNVSDKIKQKIPTSDKMRKISLVGKKLAADKHHNLTRIDRYIPTLKESDKHGQCRGIYLGFFAKNAIEFLTDKIKEEEIIYFDRPLENIVKFWKERWYNMRLPKMINEISSNPIQYTICNSMDKETLLKNQLTLF